MNKLPRKTASTFQDIGQHIVQDIKSAFGGGPGERMVPLSLDLCPSEIF